MRCFWALLPIHLALAAPWINTGPLKVGRLYHTATLLPNGKVLIAGGEASTGATNSAEIYDPLTGSNTLTTSMHQIRFGHTATLLLNGKVLVTGGGNNVSVTNSAELYDPLSGSWSITGSMTSARYYHAATLLPNGKVLVTGGRDQTYTRLSSAELYDPATGTWARRPRR